MSQEPELAIESARWLRRTSAVVQDVLWCLHDNTDTDTCLSFGQIGHETGYPRAAVRRACRLLTRHGLARYSNGLWNDDGPAGAGYGITTEGQQAANALLEMELKRIGASTQKED